MFDDNKWLFFRNRASFSARRSCSELAKSCDRNYIVGVTPNTSISGIYDGIPYTYTCIFDILLVCNNDNIPYMVYGILV